MAFFVLHSSLERGEMCCSSVSVLFSAGQGARKKKEEEGEGEKARLGCPELPQLTLSLVSVGSNEISPVSYQ